MNTDKKVVGIIGCGNMGAALVENLQKKLQLKSILVFDVDKMKQVGLEKSFSLSGTSSLAELASESDIVIIAVKPQDIEGVLKELNFKDKLIISIAAGISLDFMEKFLGQESMLVRAMPNLNALIGKSVTATCSNAAAGSGGLKIAEEIFKCVGEVVSVKDSQMNAVTAISGSGPAFVAYLYPDVGIEEIEKVMFNNAIGFGIDGKNAAVLASTTTSGTLAILGINFDPVTLIKRVSSKGGTTEAGMKVLEQKGKTEAALSEAIRAAEKRAGELSRRS